MSFGYWLPHVTLPTCFVDESIRCFNIHDIITSTGVIHAIDAVLQFKGLHLPEPEHNIVETAIDAGFDSLVAAAIATKIPIEALH